MASFVVFVLAAALLWMILYPLFGRSKGRAGSGTSPSSAVQVLLDRRETLLQALHELENDRALGSITDDDYQRLRLETEDETIVVMRVLDDRSLGLADELEREIAAVREQPTPVEPAQAQLGGVPFPVKRVR